MEFDTDLRKVIGNGRTLVITCNECCLDIEHVYSNGEVFQYTVLGNVLNPADEFQSQRILDFVQFKRCSRIIVAGHHECKALNYLRYDLPVDSPISNLHEMLTGVFVCNHGDMLKTAMANRMMVELNVIYQCNTLLKMEGLRELVENGKVCITGLIMDQSRGFKQIYRNGLGYNNFVSMN